MNSSVPLCLCVASTALRSMFDLSTSRPFDLETFRPSDPPTLGPYRTFIVRDRLFRYLKSA